MKRTALLNRHLSALVASLGHLDEIVVADAGLPIPEGVPVIDLAITAGVPTLFDVLGVLATELVIESMISASEKSEALAQLLEAERSHWAALQAKPIAAEVISHEAFKKRTAHAKAIIRTGSVKPYCNVILVSGVAF